MARMEEVNLLNRQERQKTDTNFFFFWYPHRHDFYQTPTAVIASLFLKKIIKDQAKVDFDVSSVTLDLRTANHTRYKNVIPLFGQIDTANSTFKIMGTKLELTLVKADRTSWPVLRSDERVTEIIQVGQAGRAL